jgi:hypothetical protein
MNICAKCFLPLIFLTYGCSVSNSSHPIHDKKIATNNHEAASPVINEENNNGKVKSHLEQCHRDLESLRTVNPASYSTYLARYDALMKSSAGFLSVKDDVSSEVAELARPRFQFALVNLCFRIKNSLAQSLINQTDDSQ